MNAAEPHREEEHFRKVEGAMLHAEDAARRLDEAAKELTKDDAATYLIAALETAAGAVRAGRARLMKSAYWPAPSNEQQELASDGGEQQRLASWLRCRPLAGVRANRRGSHELDSLGYDSFCDAGKRHGKHGLSGASSREAALAAR